MLFCGTKHRLERETKEKKAERHQRECFMCVRICVCVFVCVLLCSHLSFQNEVIQWKNLSNLNIMVLSWRHYHHDRHHATSKGILIWIQGPQALPDLSLYFGFKTGFGFVCEVQANRFGFRAKFVSLPWLTQNLSVFSLFLFFKKWFNS